MPYKPYKPCLECGGASWYCGNEWVECSSCHGTGNRYGATVHAVLEESKQAFEQEKKVAVLVAAAREVLTDLDDCKLAVPLENHEALHAARNREALRAALKAGGWLP